MVFSKTCKLYNACRTTRKTDQATKNKFSDEDVVFKVDKNGCIKFGIAVDTAEDYDSSIFDSDEEFDESVGKGEVRVIWLPNGKDQIVKERNIHLADRRINPGDTVRRSSENNSQKGYCRNVTVLADVQLKDTPYVIKNVRSDRLIYDVPEEQLVMLDGWIGMVTKVKQKVVLKTQYGGIVEVRYTDFHKVKLRDFTNKHRNEHFNQITFHPGQTVIGSVDALKNTKWLTPKPKVGNSQNISFLVTHVEIEGINVNFGTQTKYVESIGKEHQPNQYVTGSDLNRVKFIAEFPWDIHFGDDALFLIEENDLVNLTTTSEWRMEQLQRSYFDKMRRPSIDFEDNYNIIQNAPFYSVFKLDSEAEDMNDWQNNDYEKMNDDWKTEDGWQTENDHETEDEKQADDQNGDKAKTDEAKTDEAKTDEKTDDKASTDQITDVNKRADIDSSADAEQQNNDKTDDSDTKLSFILNTVRKTIVKKAPQPAKKRSTTKLLHPGYKLKHHTTSNQRLKMPTIGDGFRIEVILTHTQVTVVWQDGTIERIPSKELLVVDDFGDKEEFFPGDFVIYGSDKSKCENSNYGVVQTVDQNERTAIVKWLHTSSDDTQSKPELIKETSIYDLTRHPDYNYDYKTQVCRIDNFEGDNVTCVVGYVRHSDSDGLITVAWVDGHNSKCLPTDIATVCSYRQFIRSNKPKIEDLSEPLYYLLHHIQSDFNYQFHLAEKALNNFTTQQTNDISEKSEILLAFNEVHRNCQFLDTLMATSFFSEDEFTDMVAKALSRLGIKNEQKDVTSATNLQDSHDSGNNSKNDSNECIGVSSDDSTEAENLYDILHAVLKTKLKLALDELSRRVSTFPSKDKHDLLALNNIEMNESGIHNSTTIEGAECLDFMSSSSLTLSSSHSEGFIILENSPNSHKFKSSDFAAIDLKKFHRAVKADHQILRTSLPSGVYVKAYEDRMDLLSVMIDGPKNTPYEDGIFLFDFQLSKDYPHTPPLCHYISFCSDRLNPNLYENGKVCVSLLGTWSGNESEMWGTGSTFLQIIISFQGLILVAEPFYNEPGYTKEKGTREGDEKSQMYNELAVLKVIESMTNVMAKPSEIFRDEIFKHFRERGDAIIGRIEGWIDQSNEYKPEFPLIPTTRGFRIKLKSLLVDFRKQLDGIGR